MNNCGTLLGATKGVLSAVAVWSEQVTWSSSIDGVLPGGNLLRTRDLSLGTHQLVATVADADGAQAESTVTIEVLPRTSPTRYTERPVALVLTHLGLPADVGRVQADTPLPADDQSCPMSSR